MDDLNVYACDAGSVSKDNFHWVSTHNLSNEFGDISKLAEYIATDLKASQKVAIGFECVLFIPCPTDQQTLGKARNGECTAETGNKPFTASAGACATMSGLPALGWLMRQIKKNCPEATATTRWSDFESGLANIFIWEAFVSGHEKGDTHGEDARLAVEGFMHALPTIENSTRVTATEPFSFAGSLILWSDLSSDTSLLKAPVIVIRPNIPKEVIQERIEKAKRVSAEKRRLKKESS